MTNIYDKYCSRKTNLWIISMLLSFTAALIVLIIAKNLKFDYYHSWIYRANFKDPKVFLLVKNQYFWDEVFRLYLCLPLALVADVTLRKFLFAKVAKPQ